MPSPFQEIELKVGSCPNCLALRASYDKKPAVPQGGSSRDRFHACPLDGNRWVQDNIHFHLWQMVLTDQEWERWHRAYEVPEGSA